MDLELQSGLTHQRTYMTVRDSAKYFKHIQNADLNGLKFIVQDANSCSTILYLDIKCLNAKIYVHK